MDIAGLLIQWLIGAGVIAVGLILPRLVRRSRRLHRLVSAPAIDVTQAIVLAYGLIFGLLLPTGSFLVTVLS